MPNSDASAPSEDREALYARAQMAWGHDAQMAKAAEEFAELAAAVNRAMNGQADARELLEEMADAKLMLEQLETDFTDEAVEEAFQEKVAALEARLPGGDQ